MRYLASIVLALFLVSCGPGINKILKSKDPAYKLKMADQFYEKKKYEKAQTVYQDIMPYYKTNAQYQDIYYKYAYAAYYQNDYANAENLFKTFLESFPSSLKTEEVEYMRAYSFYKQSPKPELDQTNTYKAIGMLQTFINTHPGSVRNAEAQRLIDEMRKKLETKSYKAAKLYYDMGQYRAAGVSFSALLENYPEAAVADEYQYMAVKSYFRFAELSIADKKTERYQEVVNECNDFIDRFPNSGYRKEVDNFLSKSKTEIKKYSNEQIKTSA